MPDKDGYPTEKELKTIEEWDAIHDPKGLLQYIQDRWWYADRQFCLTGKRVLKLELHTGGWSGNESIVEALQKNVFWFFWWQGSRRGGHYTFEIPVKK